MNLNTILTSKIKKFLHAKIVQSGITNVNLHSTRFLTLHFTSNGTLHLWICNFWILCYTHNSQYDIYSNVCILHLPYNLTSSYLSNCQIAPTKIIVSPISTKQLIQFKHFFAYPLEFSVQTQLYMSIVTRSCTQNLILDNYLNFVQNFSKCNHNQF